MSQAEVNIGMLGHVDHGKTSLTKCLTGSWTDTHSEEVKRGITIRLGYADSTFRKCESCPAPESYTISENCPKCGNEAKVLRRVSFLDAPGHETLMATVIAASSIMDGAILVIAANEECPRQQTLEHLMVLDFLGIKRIVIVQNKVDLVTPEKAKENSAQIRALVKGTVAENAPIIPVVANFGFNVDAVIQAIEEHIPTPKRDLESPPRLFAARSFDVNKPGAEIKKLIGGVIGGSLIQGKLSIGDRIEIRPGIKVGEKDDARYVPLKLTVESLNAGAGNLKKAIPGGLVAIGTKLDPSITKSDGLVGNLVGAEGSLPPAVSELQMELTLLQRPEFENPPLKQNEPLVLGVGTATTVGFVEKTKKSTVQLKLKRPICVDKDAKIAVSRRIGQRWRLSGYGIVK